MMKEVFSTDWLGLPKIFYNERTKKVSYNINNVIDYDNLEFDPDGLHYYLDFGYSVFGLTPIKNVKFLLPNCDLSLTNGDFTITEREDPVLDFLYEKKSEEETIEIIRKEINQWESKHTEQTIIIPTSGGYDSRLINSLIKNKKNIKSFTYGTSENQRMSIETVYAEYICKKLNIQWNFVPLTHINDYIKKWYELYGVSTHAHGMYHIEFYEKIHTQIHQGNVISGFIGDVWSGNVNIRPINNSDDVSCLGYAHGINANSEFCKLGKEHDYAKDYFCKNKTLLKNSKYRIVESMRFKSILLSYLFTIPESYGFKTWSPFTNVKVAMSMLNLPHKRRENRIWQEEYFKKMDLYPEKEKLVFDKNNILDLESLNQVKIHNLDRNILGVIIDEKYIDKINSDLNKLSKNTKLLKAIQKMITYYPINMILNKIGLNKGFYSLNSETYKSYTAYMTLYPLEQLLCKCINKK